MPEIDIARLRDLARRADSHLATSPWAALWNNDEETWQVLSADESIVANVASCGAPGFSARDFARFVAGFCPDVALALLDRLERAEKLSEAMSLKARLVQEAHEKALEQVASLEAERNEAQERIKRVLDWVRTQGCSCPSEVEDLNGHGDACAGEVERLLRESL